MYEVSESGLLVHNADPNPELCDLLRRRKTLTPAETSRLNELLKVDTPSSGTRVFSKGEADALRELDIAPYGDFSIASRVGDKLAGHEVLQNAWLQVMGFIENRGVGAASRANPALAVGKKLHKAIGAEQRALGLFNPKILKHLTAQEIIQRNIIALRRAGVPAETIKLIAEEALKHAKTLSK